jgi:Protein of unknown function, DUF547
MTNSTVFHKKIKFISMSKYIFAFLFLMPFTQNCASNRCPKTAITANKTETTSTIQTPNEAPKVEIPKIEEVIVAETKSIEVPVNQEVTPPKVIIVEEIKTVETPQSTNQPINQSTNQPISQSTNQPINPSTTLNDLLLKYVSSTGKVNYKELKTSKAEIEEVAKAFQDNPPQESWSKDEKLAYWLNVYNLFTLKLIVDNYPISSITKLDNGKPWDVKRIDIDGKKYSLNDIENVIIRPKFKDARIHFGINCAAKSCPPLHNEAFSAENVQTLLTQRTRKFIRSSSNKLTENSAEISKIFDWYSADFGDIVAFLNKYATVKVAKGAKISYADYNWDLNSN